MESAVYQEVNLAQLFRNRSATYGNALRWRQKMNGAWKATTWQENLALVNSALAGLDALGAMAGDVIGIISNTRWEWMVADWAILGLGGTTVSIYPSNMPATNAFILNDSDAHYLFIENKEQYDKLVGIREQIPQVRRLISFDDISGINDDWVISFASLCQLSARSPAEADTFAAERASAIQPEQVATLVYTSGTTGRPKGVVLTHAILMAQIVGIRQALDTVQPGMVDLLFLPLAHVFGREEHFAGVDRGLSTAITSSFDTLADDLKEVKPDLFFSVPRVYEKAYASIHARVAAGSGAQQHIFHWAERVARQVSHVREQHKAVTGGLQLQQRLADRLVFARIREALGGNVKFAITAAAPLDLNILEFFNGAGVLLLEGWGMTETSGGFTVNRTSNYRFGSVGTSYTGHEIRLDDDDEILVRGACVFAGYHNNAAANAESFTEDGWFHTGDIGTLDEQGFLRIVDRKKDLIITAAGKNIAPQLVENTLKKARYVSQVAVYGDRKPYLVALVTLDSEQVANWAKEAGVSYNQLAEIAAHPQFRTTFAEGFQAANTELASYETVKYYDILPEDFTIENDLLTPTLKIRRRSIYQRYQSQFEALYRPTPAEVLQK